MSIVTSDFPTAPTWVAGNVDINTVRREMTEVVNSAQGSLHPEEYADLVRILISDGINVRAGLEAFPSTTQEGPAAARHKLYRVARAIHLSRAPQFPSAQAIFAWNQVSALATDSDTPVADVTPLEGTADIELEFTAGEVGVISGITDAVGQYGRWYKDGVLATGPNGAYADTATLSLGTTSLEDAGTYTFITRVVDEAGVTETQAISADFVVTVVDPVAVAKVSYEAELNSKTKATIVAELLAEKFPA